MRIIFLDVDGVLNNDETTDRYCGFVGIDPKLVEKLKWIYDISDKEEETRIVVSSSWRYDKIKKEFTSDGCYDYLLDRLKEADMEVIGMTPMHPKSGWHRGAEILQWLKENKEEMKVSSFVILDDEFFDFLDKDINLGKNLARCSYYDQGLTYKKCNRALKILRGEDVEEEVNEYFNEDM